MPGQFTVPNLPKPKAKSKAKGKPKGKDWIAGAVGKPGALHSQLGVPAGKKIPAGKLKAAASGKMGPLAAKRADLAKTLGKLGK